jgi:type I restriction enzyme S subunit
MINLDAESLMLLKTILRRHVSQYEAWLFGSRATAHCKPYSDIDVAIISPEPIMVNVLAELESELAASDLPYKVDLVDFASASPEFQQVIINHYEIINFVE